VRNSTKATIGGVAATVIGAVGVGYSLIEMGPIPIKPQVMHIADNARSLDEQVTTLFGSDNPIGMDTVINNITNHKGYIRESDRYAQEMSAYNEAQSQLEPYILGGGALSISGALFTIGSVLYGISQNNIAQRRKDAARAKRAIGLSRNNSSTTVTE